jgi:uncharacterized protein (TIGR00252 family)
MSQKTSAGQTAETAAASYLVEHGFSIIERNWRTKWCEIDIVASKAEVLYFVEVKYRQSTNQGEGLSYITPTKLKQMRFAANFWIADQGFLGDCELAAIGVAGFDFSVVDFVVGLD